MDGSPIIFIIAAVVIGTCGFSYMMVHWPSRHEIGSDRVAKQTLVIRMRSPSS